MSQNKETYGSDQKFIEIQCLEKGEQERILEEIEKTIERKKKEGIVTDKQIREIEEMTLRLFSDFLDVQSVYEDFLFQKKTP